MLLQRQKAKVEPVVTEKDRIRERFRYLIETAKTSLELADRSLAAAQTALEETKAR